MQNIIVKLNLLTFCHRFHTFAIIKQLYEVRFMHLHAIVKDKIRIAMRRGKTYINVYTDKSRLSQVTEVEKILREQEGYLVSVIVSKDKDLVKLIVEWEDVK